jgi:amino acid adenylation domain-containing protein
MYKQFVRSANTSSDSPKSHTETEPLLTSSNPAFSSGRLVPQLISDYATRDPEHVALVGESMQFTFGELDAKTDALAHHLRALGIVANTVVAVYMRRSPLAVVAALAVLKAGGAYLPIDSNYPVERVSFILSDSRAPVVISESTIAGKLPAGDWQLILLDRDTQVAGGNQTNGYPYRIRPDHLAYVIYTSGSTGTPKGVEITHENLLNLVYWHRKAFAVTPEDRATQFASFGFDAAVWELWPHLTAGSAVHIVPEDARTSPELLKEWLVAHKITISFVPTALAERLITLNWPSSARLRFLLTGADTLHHYPRPGLPFALVNNYGPTEATVVATSGLVVPQEKDVGSRPPIGRPIDGVEIYIVDEFLAPQPRGEVGELCIGGAGVGRGYVNSPELTEKKFVPDPFSNTPGARMYRTGDRARWLPDGQIEYLGRMDGLIKIRGYRVEPNEIISVLNTHAAVQASAVVDREDEPGNQHLVAYVMLDQSQPLPTSTELRDVLRGHLPEYMIPVAFVIVPALPLTPNGKVDRSALPAPDGSNTLSDENYVSPRTALEEKLSTLVANLLGVAHVGVNDNFFLIGGHSLFGTQLIARIRDTFGAELPLRSVFESPTPALLAQQVEAAMIARLNAMSDEDVQRALAQASSVGGQK